jgi:hypothetical protein
VYPEKTKKIEGTTVKSSKPEKKAASTIGDAKKRLPAASERKALPAPDRKLLMPPPPAPKGTYDKSVAPFKGPSKAPSTYNPSVTSAATVRPTKPKAVPVASVAQKPLAQAKTSSPAPFSKTTPGGKVVMDPRSRPGFKAPGASPTAAQNKGPIPIGSVAGGTGSKSKSAGAYGGPIALGGLAAPAGAPTKAKAPASRAAPSVAGSVSGGGYKPKPAGYQGPLSLGNLA